MSGDTAWMLVSAALVMFMVPGLALFYGGMVGTRNVLNMLNMNLRPFAAILIGAVAGVVCFLAIALKIRFSYGLDQALHADRLQLVMTDIAGPGSNVRQRRGGIF